VPEHKERQGRRSTPRKIVTEIYEAISDGNLSRAADPFEDGIVLVVHGPNVETGTYTGREEASRWFGRWFAAFAPGYEMEVEELREFGDRVLVVQRHHGQGRTSGVPVEMRNACLISVRDGKVRRIEIYGDVQEGLDAARSS
jgi:ketosteroid isomerase-like protein